MQKNESGSSKINSASLIDLKAELYRKQEEYKAQKLANQNEGYIKGKPSSSLKKPTIWSKKNKGVSERAQKDFEEKQEEEDVFERSKKSLANKAKLYDKIAHGSDIPEEDGSHFFLVDFQKKVIDDKQERRRRDHLEKEAKEQQDEEDEERQLSEQPIPEPDTPEEEWVDYTDSLGRSRRCLRADLPSLQRRDQQFYNTKIEKSGINDLMSSDMHRENERQKWEKEEEETMEAEKKGPIHYGDVLHKEIRSHGVAFYKFDKDESMRQEQMDELMKLREQTKDERSKSERIKAKRKEALAARISKVKQRKREKLGLPEEEDEKGDSEEDIGPKLGEAVEAEKGPEPLTRDEEWRKNMTTTREWDQGKQSLPEKSEQQWLEKQRKERLEDFAPPSFYYTEKPPHRSEKTGTFNSLFNSDGSRNDVSDKSDNMIKDMIGKQLSDLRTEMDRDTEQIEESSGKVEWNNSSIDTSTTLNPTARIIGNLFKPTAVSHGNISESANQTFNMAPPPPVFGNSYPPVNVHVPPPPPPEVMNTPPFQDMSVPPPFQGNLSAPPTFPQNMSVPPHFPQNMSAPPHFPQNMSAPLTFQGNLSAPSHFPQNMSAPPHFPQNMSAPPHFPQNMSAPPHFPQNMSAPPPQLGTPMPAHVDMSVPPPSWNTLNPNQSLLMTKQERSGVPIVDTPVSVSGTSTVTSSETKTKFIPRTSVLDTRYMQSDDTD